MKIVIIGAGKVGAAIATELASENHDVVILEPDREVLERLCSELDILGVCGNGLLEADQEAADVGKAQLVLAVTRNDETNIICCLMAKALGAVHTVARVRDPEYSAQAVFMREKLGIDLLVNPEYEAAKEITRLLRYTSADHVDSFGGGLADLAALRIDENSPLVGMALKDFPSLGTQRVLACAIERGDEVIIPDGSTVIEEDDLVYFVGTYASLNSLFHKIGEGSSNVKAVLIIGGGRIGHYLAKRLIEDGVKVKIIEQDIEACERLSDSLPKATIVCGDGTDKRLLFEEGMSTTDCLVSLTGNDEVNMILSLYAHSCGTERVITKVNDTSFAALLGDLDLGAIVSPKNVTSAQIVKLTRSLIAADESSISALYKIASGKAEAVEFEVTESEVMNIPLKELKLKSGIIIAGILRDKTYIVPNGNSVLKEGDSAIVVTAKYMLGKLSDILV